MAGWEFAAFVVERVALDSKKKRFWKKKGFWLAEISSFQVQLEKFSSKKRFCFAEKAFFSVHARQCKNEKPFINPPRQHFPTAPKLTCSHKFHLRNPTVSLQYNNPFSKLRNLALAVQLPFRTDSNPHRRYPGRLRFPVRPVT